MRHEVLSQANSLARHIFLHRGEVLSNIACAEVLRRMRSLAHSRSGRRAPVRRRDKCCRVVAVPTDATRRMTRAACQSLHDVTNA